jgi:hypothetical protein
MPQRFNTARRIRNILSALKDQATDTRTMVVWASAFQCADRPNPQFETYRLLGIFTDQVNQLALEVEALDLEQEDYDETFKNLTQLVGVTNLDMPWREYQPYVTNAMISQLGMIAQISPITEPVIPLEDIEQFKEDLQNFQREVSGSDIDNRLKAFVLQQIEIMLRAIREYPIRGVEAIKAGDAALVTNALSEQELIQEHKGEKVLQETGSFWQRMRSKVPKVTLSIDVGKILTGVDWQKAIEAGSDAIDKLPPGAP